jgi:phosphomannomutase
MKISISGIRGIYDDDLNLHDAVKFSRLFGSYISKFGISTCLLARDTRPSSDVLLKAVSAGLMEQGINVFNLNVAPTPIAFRESRKYKSALIVTASHNPLEWNGLKFVIDGRGIFEDELDTMLNGQVSPAITYGKMHPVYSSYIQDVVDLIKVNGYADNIEREKTVGFDPGGGAVCRYIPDLFKMLGQKSYSINDIEGISSRTPDPTTDELLELRELVTNNKLHFGFAFDMDGDRLVVVDKNGKKLTPDLTLLLCVAGTIQHGMKKYVTSLDTSNAVSDIIKLYGGSLSYSKVGEANVVQAMMKIDAEAGGEGSSAGFIMPKFNMCRDGMLSASIIASLNDKSVKECKNLTSRYEIIRTKIRVDQAKVSILMQKLKDRLKEQSSDLLELDGIKALVDESSWILIRPSNTENALRISVESLRGKASTLYKKTEELVLSIHDQVK